MKDVIFVAVWLFLGWLGARLLARYMAEQFPDQPFEGEDVFLCSILMMTGPIGLFVGGVMMGGTQGSKHHGLAERFFGVKRRVHHD